MDLEQNSTTVRNYNKLPLVTDLPSHSLLIRISYTRDIRVAKLTLELFVFLHAWYTQSLTSKKTR